MLWEYIVIDLETRYWRDHQRKLNAMGAGGWELVAVVSSPQIPVTNYAYFKRPMAAPATPVTGERKP